MNDLNKITNTRIGDNIHYYVNGKEDRGVVVKMNNAYVSVLKGNGSIDEIHINDTFFIKDILTNKTWNGMTLEERTIELNKAHAYSPRFLAKTWEQLPQELKDVLQKTNIEESTHGQLGGNRAGISTATDVKTPEDYKGETDDRDKQTKEEFKHDNDKPTVDKNNGMEESHKEDEDGMHEDWRKTGGNDDKQKNYINKDYVAPTNRRVSARASTTGWQKMIDANAPKKKQPKAVADENTKYFDDKGNSITREQHEAYSNKGEVRPDDLWKSWLEKFTGGDLGKKPEYTSVEEPKSTLQQGRGNRATTARRSSNPRVNPTAADFKDALDKVLPDKDPSNFSGSRHEQANQKRGREEDSAGQRGKPSGNRRQQPRQDDRGHKIESTAQKFQNKSYGKPLYGVTDLEKEGDGAGNSGVNSLETTGVYNARYSDNKGRYRDQEKDKE